MNRMKEKLKDKKKKTELVSRETWKKLQHGEWLCAKQLTAKIRNTNGNSKYIKHRYQGTNIIE